MAIHSSGRGIFCFTHIEGIAGGASGIGVDRIREDGDRASEGQAAEVNGAGFTVGSLARKRARVGTRGTGINVSSDKELTEVGRTVEGD